MARNLCAIFKHISVIYILPWEISTSINDDKSNNSSANARIENDDGRGQIQINTLEQNQSHFEA